MTIIALNPASDARLAVQAEAAYGTIGSWDTSRVDDMSFLFNIKPEVYLQDILTQVYHNPQAKDFNEDIGHGQSRM